MAPIHDMRRRFYGSIDFDFYRVQTVALRSQARRDDFKPKAAFRVAMAAFATAFPIAVVFFKAIAQRYLRAR